MLYVSTTTVSFLLRDLTLWRGYNLSQTVLILENIISVVHFYTEKKLFVPLFFSDIQQFPWRVGGVFDAFTRTNDTAIRNALLISKVFTYFIAYKESKVNRLVHQSFLLKLIYLFSEFIKHISILIFLSICIVISLATDYSSLCAVVSFTIR